MEKIIWFFRRKPESTREAYHEHYVTTHMEYGVRLNRALLGYTVNLVRSDGADPDAVTEIWAPSINTLLRDAYDTPEDAQTVYEDHLSFMGPMDAFQVEETVLRDGPLDAPAPDPGKWLKVVSVYRAGEDPGDIPATAFRVTDNRVVDTVFVKDQLVAEAPAGSLPIPDVALIRMAWFGEPADAPAPGPATMHVSDRRMVPFTA